jgi:hypothetical protein
VHGEICVKSDSSTGLLLTSDYVSLALIFAFIASVFGLLTYAAPVYLVHVGFDIFSPHQLVLLCYRNINVPKIFQSSVKFVSKTSTRERLNTSEGNLSQSPAFPRLPTSLSNISNNKPTTQRERKRECKWQLVRVVEGIQRQCTPNFKCPLLCEVKQCNVLEIY